MGPSQSSLHIYIPWREGVPCIVMPPGTGPPVVPRVFIQHIQTSPPYQMGNPIYGLEVGSNTSTVALRVMGGEKRGTQCWGYNWTTLFLWDINTATWPSRLGESRIWDSKIWSWVPQESDLRMTALARTNCNCKLQTCPLVRESNKPATDSNKNLLVSPRWVHFSKIDWPIDCRSQHKFDFDYFGQLKLEVGSWQLEVGSAWVLTAEGSTGWSQQPAHEVGVGWSPPCKDVSPEAEEHTSLEVATKQHDWKH
jgi:hypothetical protein